MIDDDAKKKLDKLKREMGARSYSEVIRTLVDVYNAYVETTSIMRVRNLLCNEFKEARFSLIALIKFLEKFGFKDTFYLRVALNYLKESEEGIYVVDLDKCAST